MTTASEHIGSTLSIGPGSWRVVVHWHRHRGKVIPAGVEVRCYAVDGDDPDDIWGGQQSPRHELPRFDEGTAPRSITGDLVAKRVRWGDLLAEHASQLGAWMDDAAAEDPPLHAPSVKAFKQLAEAAGAKGDRSPRADERTYRLVAALYQEAQRSLNRGRPALHVLRGLNELGWTLDEENDSDRVKVRQWIRVSRKRYPDAWGQEGKADE